mgnify:CR=1 FL=1
MNKRLGALTLVGLALAMLAGCADRKSTPLQQTQPAAPPSAVAGATYVGQAQCETCHRLETSHFIHTTHSRLFASNPRNELEARGCESCHGPGSAHAQNPSSKNIIAFTREGGLPPAEQNKACLQCHTGGERMFWHGSVHEMQDLACSDCHNPMANVSATRLERGKSINDTCFSCHQDKRAEFRKRSHMPLLEGKLSCVDCHNPHGSTTDPLLRADSVNQLCYQCHAEKRGPFLWEHAPVRENCLNCHNPHGSNHDKLLVTARPFLCQQCHTSVRHPNDLLTGGNLADGNAASVRLMSRACLSCHTQIHGSNHPSGVRFHR